MSFFGIMHEWALAESIIITALENAKKNHIKILTDMTIQLGELQQIEQDILKFALTEILTQHNQNKQHVTFHIKIEYTKLRCTYCLKTWGFKELKNTISPEEAEAIHFLPEVAFAHTRCPYCGKPDFEIIKGRGVSLLSIKGKG